MGWGGYDSWPQYVPVGKRIEAARKLAAKRAKASGRQPEPVAITGSGIAKTFWGKAWCRNLEGYSDFSNRLPRGRTYARNGSVVDLLVTRGRIEAIVAGSTVYDVAIAIGPLSPPKWRAIKADCAGSIGSLVDLLTGRLDDDVMRRLARPGDGMFPSPREVNVKCSCPDGARLCKHLAAVLYGIGSRLDTQPDLLFLLRGVDQQELVAAATKESVSRAMRGEDAHTIAADDLAEIFGIDLGPPATKKVAAKPGRRPQRKPGRKSPTARSRGSRGGGRCGGTGGRR
ncbi:MAG: SWIM zinc finger family protein [Planctomycetaceae bacterium]